MADNGHRSIRVRQCAHNILRSHHCADDGRRPRAPPNAAIIFFAVATRNASTSSPTPTPPNTKAPAPLYVMACCAVHWRTRQIRALRQLDTCMQQQPGMQAATCLLSRPTLHTIVVISRPIFYMIVIDAGSSGSRLQIYSWTASKSPDYKQLAIPKQNGPIRKLGRQRLSPATISLLFLVSPNRRSASVLVACRVPRVVSACRPPLAKQARTSRKSRPASAR